jgi:hypothetical protein
MTTTTITIIITTNTASILFTCNQRKLNELRCHILFSMHGVMCRIDGYV